LLNTFAAEKNENIVAKNPNDSPSKALKFGDCMIGVVIVDLIFKINIL
jgi:hypothetical protein